MSEDSREVYSEENMGADAYFEESEFYSEQEMADSALEANMSRRRKRLRGRKRRRKILGVLAVILLFAMLGTMCGRDIVKLKAENYALQKQQEELKKERDKLRKEVENSGNRDYVQEQARKQLRLLHPGELLFTFEEEEEEKKTEKEQD